MARRLQAMKHPNYVSGFDVSLHENALDIPLKWARPRTIFVNSMSDLFHKDVPLDFILQIFAVMSEAHWHTFQVLTKRAERLQSLAPSLPWLENAWMGVSVESSENLSRIDHLREVPARTRFISFEPLLEGLGEVDLHGIDWAIVGGESGPGARPMRLEWAVELRDQCVDQGVPFFFKQWGGVNKKRSGRQLEGRIWSEYPSVQHAASRQLAS